MKALCLRLKLFILHILFRKEEKQMAEVYATLIVKGARTFNQVPAIIQQKVREVLEALDLGELAQ